MLLRFRGPDGMIRQEAGKDDTFGDIMLKVRTALTLLDSTVVAATVC